MLLRTFVQSKGQHSIECVKPYPVAFALPVPSFIHALPSALQEVTGRDLLSDMLCLLAVRT